MGNMSAKRGVVKMVQEWIREQEKADVKGRVIAKQLGCTRTQMINIRDGTRGVGPQVEQAFADLLYHGSVDKLREAAGEGRKSTVPPSDDDAFAQFDLTSKELLTIEYAMQCEGISPDAIVRSLRTFYRGAGSLDGADLLETFRIAQRQLDRGIRGVEITEANSQEHIVPFDDLKKRTAK